MQAALADAAEQRDKLEAMRSRFAPGQNEPDKPLDDYDRMLLGAPVVQVRINMTLPSRDVIRQLQAVRTAAERAIAIMEQYGLAPMAYGFICHDAWEAREEILDAEIERRPVLDENGDQVWVLIPNGEDLIRLPVIEEIEIQPERALVHPPGDLYGFRTDELLLFLAVGFEARLSALEGGV